MDGASQASLDIVTHNYAPFNAAVAKYIEKLEQPDPRIAGQAFREKARGVGHVLKALGVAALLTLIGVSLVMLCQQPNATAPVENNPSAPPGWPVPQPPSGGTEKVVINYTLFTTVDVAEGIDVVTGWDFAKSTDNKPERQFCYLRTPEKFGTRNINLAHRSESGALIWQTSPSAFDSFIREIHGLIGEIDYETALGKCRWFPG
jgi:hypothetical protein